VPLEPVLEREGLATLERGVENLEAAGKVVSVNRVVPPVREQSLRRSASESAACRVDVGAAFIGVRHPYQDRVQFGDRTHI
jgi:hypothetical protein